jgi:hypothetical protein
MRKGWGGMARLWDLSARDDRLVLAHLMTVVLGSGMAAGLTPAQALRVWVEEGPPLADDEGLLLPVGRVAWAATLSPDDVLPPLPETAGGRARRGRG